MMSGEQHNNLTIHKKRTRQYRATRHWALEAMSNIPFVSVQSKFWQFVHDVNVLPCNIRQAQTQTLQQHHTHCTDTHNLGAQHTSKYHPTTTRTQQTHTLPPPRWLTAVRIVGIAGIV